MPRGYQLSILAGILLLTLEGLVLLLGLQITASILFLWALGSVFIAMPVIGKFELGKEGFKIEAHHPTSFPEWNSRDSTGVARRLRWLPWSLLIIVILIAWVAFRISHDSNLQWAIVQFLDTVGIIEFKF
jgi:hypothetical protein